MIFIQKLTFETLPSTNTYAKENICNLSLPSLIIADHQSAGRGRRGKSFFSPKGTGLYMTLVFEEKSNSELLTPLAAVSVCEELEKLGASPKIKWVNDILVESKKICGILAERQVLNGRSYIILGIGINISTADFPENLSIAGSLGINCDKNILAEKISERILSYINESDSIDIISEYRSRLFIIGKNISYFRNNFRYVGYVKDINNQCNLIITLPDGKEDILSSGEISIIL